jgi:hypothetical protein
MFVTSLKAMTAHLHQQTWLLFAQHFAAASPQLVCMEASNTTSLLLLLLLLLHV